MPVDYSKWDALELSDDSDIEVHPNVDKKSFIRAKQNQIHQNRFDRKHRIETLKYERLINNGLLLRIDALLKSLKSHEEEAKQRSKDVDGLVFQAVMESTGGSLKDDKPPKAPPGVHAQEEQPHYSQMLAALVDQVKKTVDEQKSDGRYGAFIKEVGEHETKVKGLQKDLEKELAKLEKEDQGKITSEGIHYGFDSSSVTKSAPAPKTSTEPELLNPGRPAPTTDFTASNGAADSSIDFDDDEDMRATPMGTKFASFKTGDYRGMLQFISSNPSIVSERETDRLLGEAFNAQSEGEDQFARQCVHQALLIQYCRQLGKDGVGLFFKRITTPGHQASKLFLDDVNTTYNRIRTRCKEIAEERKQNGGEGVEQIQLHAVDPNTKINITVPDALAQDEESKQARRIFEAFPLDLQTALESGELDKINVVLGKMKVEDAEKVVELLGDGGMLNIEEGVLDATTEEGQAQVAALEREAKATSAAAATQAEDTDAGDPP